MVDDSSGYPEVHVSPYVGIVIETRWGTWDPVLREGSV